jgi:uncharacterized Zn finger protein
MKDELNFSNSFRSLQKHTDTLIVQRPMLIERKRGAVMAWQAQAWMREVAAASDAGRLTRGRSYARYGAVRRLLINRGIAIARVQGSYGDEYTTSVAIPVFADDEWERTFNALKGQALFYANIIAGEISPEMGLTLEEIGLSLIPSKKQIVFDCTCLDWIRPCKHTLAVACLLADYFESEPTTLLLMRGRTHAQILAALDSGKPDEASYTQPLETDLALFWTGKSSDDAAERQTPKLPPPLAQVGAPYSLDSYLRKLYKIVATEARRWRDETHGE